MHSNDVLPQRRAPARIIVADDQEMARTGLRNMLAGVARLEVIGEASNGWEAVELCRSLQPDLALVDVRMPELDGLAATRVIKQERPEISVIIITNYENPDYLLDALQAGAAGYILKDATRSELIAAIRRVLRGDAILNGELAARAFQQLVREAPRQESQQWESWRSSSLALQRASNTLQPQRLTRREHEVLSLLAQGRTNPEIAQTLTVSVGTVKTHVEHIIGKLEVSDRTQAVVRAIALGMLTATAS